MEFAQMCTKRVLASGFHEGFLTKWALWIIIMFFSDMVGKWTFTVCLAYAITKNTKKVLWISNGGRHFLPWRPPCFCLINIFKISDISLELIMVNKSDFVLRRFSDYNKARLMPDNNFLYKSGFVVYHFLFRYS